MTMSIASVLLSGCTLFSPRIGAHGTVVDQYGKPVTNALLKAQWQASQLNFWTVPVYERTFKADTNGNWEFYAQGVDVMSIVTIAADGYDGFYEDACRLDDLHYKNCPTNTVMFRLKKVPQKAEGESK